MVKILMVCMGNICRSPMAQAVLMHEAQALGWGGGIEVDSAGTHAHHKGEKPDPRGQAVATKRGYAGMGQLRSRLIQAEDFERFDLVVAMDRDNLAALQRLCPPQHAGKLKLLLADYAPQLGVDEVPDPYYGTASGFERVLDLCEAGVAGLLADLRRQTL